MCTGSLATVRYHVQHEKKGCIATQPSGKDTNSASYRYAEARAVILSDGPAAPRMATDCTLAFEGAMAWQRPR